MLKIVAFFNPADGVTVDAFEDWYLNKHVADARKIPGLRRYTIHKSNLAAEKSPRYFRLAELEFDDLPAAERALASPEYEHALRDAKSFIKDHARYYFDSTVIVPERE